MTARPTYAEIDLDILASNFISAKRFIGDRVKYMAVVKAQAYGHGAAECSLRLEQEGVDWFGVALPEEGVELRNAGVTGPILCLGSFWSSQAAVLIENDLTPVIYDLDSAADLQNYVIELNRTVNIHVKIDTGMGRLGLDFREAANFAAAIKEHRNLKVTGLLTHFAAAENPTQDHFTRLQVTRFEQACGQFREAGHTPEWIDLANSPGAIAHPRLPGNLVRLGGALYGLLDDILDGSTKRPLLRAVMSLKSTISYIRNVPAGESIGYGRSFVTVRDSLIGLVPIGYADGFPRVLSNRGFANISGQRAPIVGRISMDWTMVDVTDIEGVAKGDEVCLIGGPGDAVTAADIAASGGTIGYEITCGISPRVPRVFLGTRGGGR